MALTVGFKRKTWHRERKLPDKAYALDNNDIWRSWENHVQFADGDKWKSYVELRVCVHAI